jgi:RNA polymerase sigma-70 factor (ECF subfamily)
MVLRVCRRLLSNPHDAEDAFQAAFLALARKAGSIPPGYPLAAWLYGVARRVALKARAEASRARAVSPLPAGTAHAGADPLAQLTARELLQLLDEGLQRLPER